ncbi:encapsulin [Fusibacter sp. JL298sf-3]
MTVESTVGLKVSDEVVSEFLNTIEKVKNTTLGLHDLRGTEALDSVDMEVIQEVENKKNAVQGRRFKLPESTTKSQSVYTYESMPYLEPRFPFAISKEELKMIEEGLEPFELAPLEDAMRALLHFEQEVFFNGIGQPGAMGLFSTLKTPSVVTDGSPQSVIDNLLKSAMILRENFLKGPYRIIMGRDFLRHTSQLVSGRTLASIIEDELGRDIEFSNVIKGAVLMPAETDDFVIETGKELTLVVDHVTEEAVHFYLTKSFRVQFLNPNLATRLQLSENQ